MPQKTYSQLQNYIFPLVYLFDSIITDNSCLNLTDNTAHYGLKIVLQYFVDELKVLYYRYELLLTLRAYFNFTYKLFEDFEANKEIAYAFINDSALTSVTLPSSVEEIGSKAFANNDKLAVITNLANKNQTVTLKLDTTTKPTGFTNADNVLSITSEGLYLSSIIDCGTY